MRILIQIAETAASGSLPEEVQRVLQGAGATMVRASHPELRGLFTAIVPDSADLGDLLRRLKESPGVKHAEADTFRSTL